MTFRITMVEVSIGSTDIMLVYRSHTEITIRKLNPKVIMSLPISLGFLGGLPSRESAPIDNASPKTKSDRLSMRGLGCLVSSDMAVEPSLVRTSGILR